MISTNILLSQSALIPNFIFQINLLEEIFEFDVRLQQNVFESNGL